MKKRVRGIPMTLEEPDIGQLLGTKNIDGHLSFRDDLFFSLRNHLGFNEIHIHRNAANAVVYVSKAKTGDSHRARVEETSALFKEAVRRAGEVPARGN